MKRIKHHRGHIMIVPEDRKTPIHITYHCGLVKVILSVISIVIISTLGWGIKQISVQSKQLIGYEKVLKEKEQHIQEQQEELEAIYETLKEMEHLQSQNELKNDYFFVQTAYIGGPDTPDTLGTSDEGPIQNKDLKLEAPREDKDNYIPSFTPAKGPITSPFGNRRNPFNTAKRQYHQGIDIGAAYGENIYAAAKGTVSEARYMNGYGYAVFIDHHNGMETRYAHASKLLVKKGDEVEKGQLIAKVGSTGNSTGPHLHFEWLKDGVQVDPSVLFKEDNR